MHVDNILLYRHWSKYEALYLNGNIFAYCHLKTLCDHSKNYFTVKINWYRITSTFLQRQAIPKQSKAPKNKRHSRNEPILDLLMQCKLALYCTSISMMFQGRRTIQCNGCWVTFVVIINGGRETNVLLYKSLGFDIGIQCNSINQNRMHSSVALSGPSATPIVGFIMKFATSSSSGFN